MFCKKKKKTKFLATRVFIFWPNKLMEDVIMGTQQLVIYPEDYVFKISWWIIVQSMFFFSLFYFILDKRLCSYYMCTR